MKARNIIAADGTQSESFAVARHIILRNFWEYYLEEPDENGITFGFVMGNENEWGSVDYNEIKPYIISEAKGTALDEVMPPLAMYGRMKMTNDQVPDFCLFVNTASKTSAIWTKADGWME